MHTYGQEELEQKNYQTHLDKAKEVQAKLAKSSGLGMACFFFCIFGFYGYSLFWGGFLRWHEVVSPSTDEVYKGG